MGTFNILHLSDLHVGHKNNELDKLIQELSKKLKSQKIDVVIFTGDIFNEPPVTQSMEKNNASFNKADIKWNNNKNNELMNDEKKKEIIKEAVTFFERLHTILNKKNNKLQKKDFFFVAGNHDLYEQIENDTWSLYDDFITEFYKNDRPNGYNDKHMFINVVSGKILLGFDSNIDYVDGKKQFVGHITQNQLDLVDEFLENNSEYRNYEKIAFFHHPCNFFEEQKYRNTDGIMNNSLDVSKKLAEWNVKLILHGHKHWAKTSIYRPLVGQKIYVFGAGAIGSLRDQRSCYVIQMDKEIRLKEIYSNNKDNFLIRPVKIVDNYMEGLLFEAIEKWEREYTPEETTILKMIDKLYLSYEQLNLLQYNQLNLLMLEHSIKNTLGIRENEDSFGDIGNDEWYEVKRMLNNLELQKNERDGLLINPEKKCYLAFALLGKFFTEFYNAIESTSRDLVKWDEDKTEFNLRTCCYYVYFKSNTDENGHKAWQELNKIMKRFQAQLYEIQDYLYCIKINIKNIFLELHDDHNNIRHCDFDASIPRLIQLLTGTNIYCDKYSFVRELIQNSIDAVSFRENQDVMYKTKNEPIEVQLGCDDKGNKYFKIRDYGIGMKPDTIERYFATLGKSYYKEYTERKHISYNSVSNFGIGFLSVFKPCSKIIIKTKHFEEKQCYKLEINSDYGHYMISPCPQPGFDPGTEITCYFKKQEVKEEEIIAYIKAIMLDVKYNIKIKSNNKYDTIRAREVRQKEYKNMIFVPFVEDTKTVAELEEKIVKNLEEELPGLNGAYRHGILIRPEQKINAGVNILSAGILLKNARFEHIWGKNMEELHYMKVTMNYPPNWLDIDVSREKVNGIRADYINNIGDFKKNICRELKRQARIALQYKNDTMLGFFREVVNFIKIFEDEKEAEREQNLWTLKVCFEKDEIKFRLNNVQNENISDILFNKWALEILPDYDNEISIRNHNAIKLLYKSLSQDEASVIHKMLQERDNFTESRKVLQKFRVNLENIDDKDLLLVPAIFLDQKQPIQDNTNNKDELQKLIETVIWENYTVCDALERKNNLFSIKYDDSEICRIYMESDTLQDRINIIAQNYKINDDFSNKYDFIWNYIIWNNTKRYDLLFKDSEVIIKGNIQSRYEHLRDSIKIIYLKGTDQLLDIYTIASCYMSVLMDIPKEKLQIKTDTDTLAKYQWILDVGLGFLYMWILSDESDEDENNENEKCDKLYAMYNRNELDNILDDNIKNRYTQLLASQEKQTLDVLCFAELLRWIDLYIKNKVLV